MVNKFVENTLNTNKIQLLASNYSTFRGLVFSGNFIPQTPSASPLTTQQGVSGGDERQYVLRTSRPETLAQTSEGSEGQVPTWQYCNYYQVYERYARQLSIQ